MALGRAGTFCRAGVVMADCFDHVCLTAKAPLLRAARNVRRIAHLSDVHMLESGPVASILEGLAIRFVSAGRAVDAPGRARKLAQGLAAAVKGGADHVVVSGDLTEVGSPMQFEAFAQVLHDSGIAAENVTLVPGNHDAYSSGDAWKHALDGPLRAYRPTAADEPGKVVERGDVVLLPVDVSCMQPITRSAGELSPEAAEALEARFRDPGLAKKALVVVQHHHPFAHERSSWQWFDGLRGSARLMESLARRAHVQLLHGHLHKTVDRLVGLGKCRIFGAPATVDDREGAPRVRMYDLEDGRLEATGLCAI
jgi:3',5'-cyclic AMP phosphodiesterase CpdA